MAKRIRQVTYRHRLIVEFETVEGTGYNGDIDYLFNDAKRSRGQFRLEITHINGCVAPPLRIVHKSTTLSATLDEDA